MAFFGVSNLFYLCVATYIVNPNNSSSDEIYEEGKNQYKIFSQSVASNVPTMIRILSLIYFVLIYYGLIYISKKDDLVIKSEK